VPAAIQRRQLPGRWREQLVLSDGRELILRPIEPADAGALQHGFGLLTPDEVRLRFLHPMRELSSAMAERLAQPDPQREFALVAAEPLPAGQALVGAVVRAAIDASGEAAEFAILVSRYVGRQGLGRLLMKQVIRWSRLKRLQRIYGDVLDENTAMLDLARSLGFRRSHQAQDPGITRIVLDLQPPAAAH
jgi:RimJ/RimL family protein N-acetyltransferase